MARSTSKNTTAGAMTDLESGVQVMDAQPPSVFSWERIDARTPDGATEHFTSFHDLAFLDGVLCQRPGYRFQALTPLPRGAELRALREAVRLSPQTFAHRIGLPLGRIPLIEDEDGWFFVQDDSAYSDGDADGTVTYRGVCALYGAMKSYIDWRAEQGRPLEVVQKLTTAELVAAELAEVEEGRAADPHYDHRQVTVAAFDDTHENHLEVRGRFRGGWSNDNEQNSKFVQTFTPAVVLSLLDEIRELRSAASV